MLEKDLFADLALTEHPGDNDQLAEVLPLAKPEKYFEPTERASKVVKELSYEEELVKFEQDLAALRKRYRPFLENHLMPPDLERKKLALNQFDFRYKTEADNDFQHVLTGKGSWESVTIPDFRGPTGADGKWTGYYRKTFSYKKTHGKRVYIVFRGVDYIANVYLNNKFIGTHEGFFAPFEFDVTDTLDAENCLVVEVKNDYTSLGVEGNLLLDGDKLYAATGPGWDDPQTGWHHCPPGAGIYNQVYLEERSEMFIEDIFVRPDIDQNYIEVWIDLFSSRDQVINDFQIEINIDPKNFRAKTKIREVISVPYCGPGINFYRYRLPFSDFLLWESDNPYLYNARVSLIQDDQFLDQKDRHFGMSKFHLDEATEPKGMIYHNNQPIILRGANEMGHLQQCVMQGDFDQLVDDILIAKLANMNYYRITQRPVQEEIYDYCDMLGMMHQCDFPLFGTLRRNQFYEAIRQVGEMERLIRSHPSSIMVSLINEPVAIRKHPDPKHKLNRRYREKAHRHLFRRELEDFFVAARKAIALENPDRVVKNVEGDYDPPTLEGLPDFHCYCMWYTNNAIPLGKLHKGYLPPVKHGWRSTCGEYGTEGLDNYDVMQKYYPEDWLPDQRFDSWIPDKIVRAQTWLMHGDWFSEQTKIDDWIKYSQEHQALATKLMTDAFRRRADILVQTALHILIDAWPSGWMKAVVGVDRIPKPAYFAYQKSLEPVRVNLRMDRWHVYANETVAVEAWILNDTSHLSGDCEILVTLRDDEQDYASYRIDSNLVKTTSTYAGTIMLNIPSDLPDRHLLHCDAALVNKEGVVLNQERLSIMVMQKPALAQNKKIAYLGETAAYLLKKLDISGEDFCETDQHFDVILVSATDLFQRYEQQFKQAISNGVKLIFIREQNQPLQIKLGDKIISTKSLNPVYFAAINQEIPLMDQFDSHDFSYWFNHKRDQLDVLADSYLDYDQLEPLVFTYRKRGGALKKAKLPIVGTLNQGQITLCNLLVSGRIGYNPILDTFMYSLIYS